MAKVMISLPDELLARADERARERGLTRSGLLQTLVQDELSDVAEARLRKVDRLLARTARFDGRGAEHVRRDRDSR